MKLADLQTTSESTAAPVVLTVESIAFQHNDTFGPNLEAIIQEFMKMVDDGATADQIDGDLELKNRFEKLVYDRLGIKIVMVCNKQLAACMPNIYVSHSALLRDAVRKMLEPYGVMMGITETRALPNDFKLGTVNTEKAKISGWLSQAAIPFFLNFNMLKDFKVWTSAELAAISLHEFGHIFECAAKAYAVNNANQIIHDVVKHIGDKGRGGDVEYVYKELSKLDDKLSRETIEGLKSDSTVVFGISAFRMIQGTIRSLSGSTAYDRTSNEALADSFAVRFGYGDAIAVGLEKIFNDPTMVSTKIFIQLFNTWVFYFIIRSLYSICIAIAGGTFLAGGLVSIYVLIANIIGLYAMTVTNRHSTSDYEYDKNPDRIRRMKQDLINAIKDPRIDKATKIAVLEQIKVLDEVRSKVFEIPNVIQKLLLVFFASDRLSHTSVKTQMQIEQLLGNQLFVQAAKLSTKA